MGAQGALESEGSLIGRIITRQVYPWLTLGVSLILVLAPPVAAYLDGLRWDFISLGYWRVALLPAAVVIYIFVVAGILTRGETRVMEAFRSMLLLDDSRFYALVREASRFSARGEVASLGIGAVLGMVIGQSWLSDVDLPLLRLCSTLGAGLMFALLGWAIYSAVASTRVMSELHRQPLRFDILDIKSFEPVGRQSLVIALSFVGGIALSIVLGGGVGSFTAWQNWVVYPLLTVVPILVFFLNMRDTHRVLSEEKTRQLEVVQARIVTSSRTLMRLVEAEQSGGTLGGEISALVAYEERLQTARTWPYNTTMLRTLFVSVIVPGGAALSGLLFDVLFR
jgi:hypothetical protein